MAKKATPTTPSPDTLYQLNPATIRATNNSRYGLLETDVERMMASILTEGGVQEPVSVAVLDPPVDGFEYDLLKGFYRYEAVTRLNKDGAGLMLPALVREPAADALAAIRNQVTENVVRKNQSPMDTAVAISMLLEAGMPKLEVRTLYARPSGQKGAKLVPASNSWLNIHLSFLEFSKPIQKKIHEGAIGVAAAYELARVAPDKRDAVLARAEEERAAELKAEEKAEEKLLKSESKLAEARAKDEQAAAELKAAEEEKTAAAALLSAATTRYQEAAEAPGYLTMTPDEKKKVAESVKAAQADVKGAEKAVKDADRKLAKLQPVAESTSKAAESQKAKLAEARQASAAPGKHGAAKKAAVGPGNVKKAAAAEGAGGVVPLNLADIRAFVKEIATPGGMPKVTAIGKAIQECVNGVTTPKDCYRALAVITGEAKGAAAKK